MVPRRSSYRRKPLLLALALALLGTGVPAQLGGVPVAHSATLTPPAVSKAAGEVSAAVTLKSFTANGRRKGIVLKWETANESDIRLYRLWRSNNSSSRYDAVRVTQVYARGRNGRPTTYTYGDGGVLPGGVYTYFLDVQRTDGSTKQLGRVSASAPYLSAVDP